jgi:carbonic anhydrase
MDTYKNLPAGNNHRGAEKPGTNPDFFEHVSERQKPEVFWMGWSDASVPANELRSTSDVLKKVVSGLEG